MGRDVGAYWAQGICEPFDGMKDSIDLASIGSTLRSAGGHADDGAGLIAVLLGRFDSLISHGLRRILSVDQDFRVIGAELDAAALESAVALHMPQVVILDEANVIELPVIERLKAEQPTIGIVVLAHRPTVTYSMQLLARGASCLAKDISVDEILAAVRMAAVGRRVFRDVDGHLTERTYPNPAAVLTPRETEVLEYLGMGRSHAEIAHAMRLGVETVRTHSAHIRGKLGVRSKRELIGLMIPNQSEKKPQ